MPAFLEALKGETFGVPNWLLVGIGGVGIAVFAPKLLKKFTGGGDEKGGLGNTAGVSTDPNIDPNTGVPWSVENAIDPNTGLPYWATLFGPGAGMQNMPPVQQQSQTYTQPPPDNMPPQQYQQGGR